MMDGITTPQERQVLPKALRLKLAQPFNRFPFSGSGRVSSQLQMFRSERLIDGHIYGEQEEALGTVEHFIAIVDSLAQEVAYHNERATETYTKWQQQNADIAAVRRLFGIAPEVPQ